MTDQQKNTKRQERLAQQLRANLRRRKEQLRERATESANTQILKSAPALPKRPTPNQ
ncbi:hypothetical protein [Bartonella sp. DGB2]|uniref:hypothetical protein n=1 Tax=Bartonella sp. DGB2 TaxID=3388426 RepID=UPI00399025CA